MDQKVVISNAVEARAWVQSRLRRLGPGDLVLLEGELGTGKTQITRWVLELLGVTDVASPTFAIHHEYRASFPVHHFDLYRLQNAADLESCGLLDALEDMEGLIFVEWADRLDFDFWPPNRHVIRLKIEKSVGSNADEESRMISIEET